MIDTLEDIGVMQRKKVYQNLTEQLRGNIFLIFNLDDKTVIRLLEQRLKQIVTNGLKAVD